MITSHGEPQTAAAVSCSPWDVMLAAFRAFASLHGSSYAAAIAFRALFCFAPLLVIGLAIVGLFIGEDVARDRLLFTIRMSIGHRPAELAQDLLTSLQSPGAGVTAATLAGLLALHGAVLLVSELRRALNALWDVAPSQRRRGVVGAAVNTALAVAFVFGGGILLGASLAATTILGALAQFAFPTIATPAFRVSTEVVALAATTLFFVLAFAYLPNRRIRWRYLWIGALLTACLFTLGKLAVGYYVSFAGIGSAYGAAGTVVAFLTWVHFTALIILFGATLTYTWARLRGQAG